MQTEFFMTVLPLRTSFTVAVVVVVELVAQHHSAGVEVLQGQVAEVAELDVAVDKHMVEPVLVAEAEVAE